MKFATRIALLFFGMILLGALPARPASREYFKALADRSQVSLGDPLVYSVEIMVGSPEEFTPTIELAPELAERFQVGEIFNRSSVNMFNGRTFIIYFKEVHLIANRKGDQVIPPAKISMVDPQSRRSVQRFTNSVAISVREASGVPAKATPTPEVYILRPIKPRAGFSWYQLIPAAIPAGSLLTLFLMMAIIRHFVARAAARSGPHLPVDPRTPEKRAMDHLRELEKHHQPIEQKQWYTELSRILRQYMGERFAFKALEDTTTEMLAEMADMRFDPQFMERFKAFIRESDRIKFTNHQAIEADAQAALERVKALIQDPHKKLPAPEPTTTTPGEAAERSG